MYSKAKYVVGVPCGGYSVSLIAIVFPETIAHTDVKSLFMEGSIVSAGFFRQNHDGVCVFGESTSLSVGSLKTDEELVGRAIAHPNYETYA
jgi:hypothetical protein